MIPPSACHTSRVFTKRNAIQQPLLSSAAPPPNPTCSCSHKSFFSCLMICHLIWSGLWGACAGLAVAAEVVFQIALPPIAPTQTQDSLYSTEGRSAGTTVCWGVDNSLAWQGLQIPGIERMFIRRLRNPGLETGNPGFS